MNFNIVVAKLLEDFNVYPQARSIQGRPAPSPGPNINFKGAIPAGFKGAGPQGIAPGQQDQVIIKVTPKKKKKR